MGPYQHSLALLAGSIDGCISLLILQGDNKWETRTFFAHSNGIFSLSWKLFFMDYL